MVSLTEDRPLLEGHVPIASISPTSQSMLIDCVYIFHKHWKWVSSQVALDTTCMGYIRAALLDSLYCQQGEAGTKKNDSSDLP